ncbi:CVNH domain-containing protein [Xanthobacter sp. KR7-65]|uniref:CVNH domain-containing protein n=1 Tax=Xanthobacter sp. KR7-65 TaxID=3156612 RepID=UPI0032B525C9
MGYGFRSRLWLLVMLAALGSSAARAETDVPDGSYLNSCRQVQVRWGRDLAAFCQNRSGEWAVTRLNNFAGCPDDIANRDGELVCAPHQAPQPARAEVEPAGSYRKTCQRITYRNGVLSAMCRARDGDLEPTSLTLSTCPSDGYDIANVDGQLRCGRSPVYGGAPGYGSAAYDPPVARPAPPPPPQPPVGSYLNSCRNVSLKNGLLVADCDDRMGSVKHTVLAIAGCPKSFDIANQYGELVCKSGFDSGSWGGGSGSNWGGGALPHGSYLASCRDATRSGNTLTASCKDRWGRWNSASLLLSGCGSGQDISNDDGRLRCSLGSTSPSWSSNTIPPGSYLATCRNVNVGAGFLNAECQNRSGRYERTTMGLSFCGGAKDIVNTDGRLSCPRW